MNSMSDIEQSDKAAWFVARLYSGEMTPADQDALQQWLTSDVKNRKDYDETLALWDSTGTLVDDPEIQAIIPPIKTTSNSSSHWRMWGLAATLVLFIGASLLTSQTLWLEQHTASISYRTKVGEQRNITLTDGTRVMLNTLTRIHVNYTNEERRIQMDYGELFLDVAKDPNRPLTVEANGRSVRVLGTQFSISLLEKAMTVAVVEGKVRVNREESSQTKVNDNTDHRVTAPTKKSEDVVHLTAGDIATFTGDVSSVINDQLGSVKQLQSWRDGSLYFDGEPLWKVIKEVNRYSKRRIVIKGESVKQLTITGAFKVDSVDLLLRSLEDVHAIKITRLPDKVIVSPDK